LTRLDRVRISSKLVLGWCDTRLSWLPYRGAIVGDLS
jgi:hypothetical protein